MEDLMRTKELRPRISAPVRCKQWASSIYAYSVPNPFLHKLYIASDNREYRATMEEEIIT